MSLKARLDVGCEQAEVNILPSDSLVNRRLVYIGEAQNPNAVADPRSLLGDLIVTPAFWATGEVHEPRNRCVIASHRSPLIG